MSKRRTADAPGLERNQDEESQSLLQEKTFPAPAAAAASSGISSGPSGNPVLLAKLVLRKVLTILSSDDDESAPAGGDGYGPITLIKDIFVGTIFGLVTISMLIFLDHLNIIHLQSAHNFRESAFAMLNDPETLATLEESAGLKFLPVADYEAMKAEVDDAAEKLDKIRETIVERTKEKEEKAKELGPLKMEYEKLLQESNLGLEKWCGTCAWGGPGNCDSRKQYFIDTYGNTELNAKVAIMKQSPGCKGD